MGHMTEINDDFVPDESEQLDQLDPSQSLLDRGVADPLDEGYIAPDDWSPAEGYGNTAAEMRDGETLAMRLKQEVPDTVADADESVEDIENESPAEIGLVRAGRLVDANHGYPGEDREAQLVGEDVGIDGAAASAEEAAMHVIDEEWEGTRGQ
ncbi:DUF5709 domain-containing protein [Mariniluteicoccus endophyticus]